MGVRYVSSCAVLQCVITECADIGPITYTMSMLRHDLTMFEVYKLSGRTGELGALPCCSLCAPPVPVLRASGRMRTEALGSPTPFQFLIQSFCVG